MSDDTSTIMGAQGATGLRARMFAFLIRPSDSAHADIAFELQQTLVPNRNTVLFGAVSVALLLGALALVHDLFTGLATGGLFLAATLIRLSSVNRATRHPANAQVIRSVVEAGLVYAVVIGLVGTVTAMSGDPALIALASLVMTGLVFGFCITNSGAPRYAQVQMLAVILPFILAAGLSGSDAMLLLFLQTPIWIVGLFMLIETSHRRLAQLIQAQRQNRYLAYNDSLTGLANRAQVMSTLSQIALDRARASPPPYVLYLDLDGFKAVNDNHGHALGDELLRLVAQRLSESVRAGDLVGRLGGDEFIIILRDMAPDHITALARRITETISQPFLLRPGIEAKVGVSIGGAPLGENPEDAMADADTMLYSAKRDGRSTYRLTGI